MFRALSTGLTILVMLAVGSDLGQLVAASGRRPIACCCGPRGMEHGCRCTGPCCAHEPGRSHDPTRPGFDDHCGSRAAAPAAATSLQPGTPVGVRLPRPVLAASFLRRFDDPAVPRAGFAPPEPPPRAFPG